MKDGGGYAFPSEHPYPEGGPGATKWYTGMTMRQWYKGRAPIQAPSWFLHQSRPKPEIPETQINGYISCKGTIRPELQRRVDDWRGDSCYDLNDPDPAEDWTEAELTAMVKYEIAWKDHWVTQRVWKIQDLEDRYFRWRGYYADAMIAEDEEFARKGEENGKE